VNELSSSLQTIDAAGCPVDVILCQVCKAARVTSVTRMIRNSEQRQFIWSRSAYIYGLSSFVSVCLVVSSAHAQARPREELTAAVEFDRTPLPEAPIPVLLSRVVNGAAPITTQAATSGPQYSARTVPTGRLDNLIDPQEIAPALSASDKAVMGLKASVSPFGVIGWVGSGTYSETFDRSPNYGQSAKNYAQRLGAAAARASSEGIFSTSVMAPMLHEDPRYFVEGPGYPGFHRAWYALSRVLVTKTDDGRNSINYALLSGNAVGAGLTQTYYPAGNRNLHGTATTLGISLAGSGVKFLLEEFFYKEASIAQLKSKF
jgi:hypothetical protein